VEPSTSNQHERTYPLQPLDLVQRHCAIYQDPVIRASLRLDGRVDADRLREACSLLTQAVPIAACVYDDTRKLWKSCPRAEARMVRVIECTPDDMERTVRAALLARINPENGPQARFSIVRPTSGPDALVVSVTHMMCDGSGFRQLLGLVTGAYARLGGEMPSERGVAPTVPTRRTLYQVTRNLEPRRTARLMVMPAHEPHPDETLRLPATPGSSRPRLLERTIDAETFLAARSHARELGATANDLLLSAYGRTLCAALGARSVVLPCPVDLRRYARAGQTCGICNLVGLYPCRVQSFGQETLRATLVNVARQMRLLKASDTCLRGPMLLTWAARMMPFEAFSALLDAQGMPETLSYTNVGQTSSDQLCLGDVNVVDISVWAATRTWPSFQLTAHTFDGVCRLTACTDATDEDERVAQEILDVTADLVGLMAR
jgi:NRPS condensation-like uncharacterized protein